jgi:hypothetical protein
MPWTNADASSRAKSPFVSGILQETDEKNISYLESDNLSFKVLDSEDVASDVEGERTFLIGVKNFQEIEGKESEEGISYVDGEWFIQGSFDHVSVGEEPTVNISVKDLLLSIPVEEPYDEDEVVDLDTEFDRVKEKYGLEEGTGYRVQAQPFLRKMVDKEKDLFLNRAYSLNHRVNIPEDLDYTVETYQNHPQNCSISVEFVYNDLVVGRVSDFLDYIPSTLKNLRETIEEGIMDELHSADQGSNIEVRDYEGEYVKLWFQSSDFETPEKGFWVETNAALEEIEKALNSLERELKERDPEIVEELKEDKVL